MIKIKDAEAKINRLYKKNECIYTIYIYHYVQIFK